jgi:tetratricopeptide (TPR) repeat protein
VLRKDEGRANLVALLTWAGRCDEAIALLQGHVFNVWEGGTRYQTGELWSNAHLARGRARLRAGTPREALADFETALKSPVNLRANERPGGVSRQAEVAYWSGCAHAALGATDAARAAWTQAAADATTAPAGRRGSGGGSELSTGNTGPYFQALALRKLGDAAHADALLREIIRAGEVLAIAAAPGSTGTAAANLDLARTRQATAHHLAGLGHAGLGDPAKAREQFTAALAAVPDHLGAKLALGEL